MFFKKRLNAFIGLNEKAIKIEEFFSGSHFGYEIKDIVFSIPKEQANIFKSKHRISGGEENFVSANDLKTIIIKSHMLILNAAGVINDGILFLSE